jgi:hypothetical protein
MPTIANTSFNGGEISPLLYNRLELEKRQSSLALCENFLPLPYGGLRKRPGTRFCAEYTVGTNVSQSGAFLIPFQGADLERYILIVGHLTIRCYRISTATVHDITMDWPLTNADMPLLRYQILNDVIFFAHPKTHPFQLSYLAPTSWTITRTLYRSAPELDQNLEENALIAIVSNSSTPWVSGGTATVGLLVTYTWLGVMREYRCIQNHTTSTSNIPGVSLNWRNFWEIATFAPGTLVRMEAFPGITTWSSTAGTYQRGVFVEHLGVPYRCLIPHTANTNFTPGAEITATLGSYWRRLSYPFDPLHASSNNVFLPSASFSLNMRRDERAVTSELRAIIANDGRFSTPILITGPWTFNTFENWSGTFTLQRSTDNGATWEDIAQYESENDRNFAESFEEETAALIRVGFVRDSNTASSGQRRAVITPGSLFARTRITDITYWSPTEAWGIAQDLTLSGSTFRWSENAFNRRNGFPRSIAIHERRLFYAGTTRRPLDLWASRIEDFAAFRPGTRDDDPIKVTLAASSQNPILWMISQRRLYIGTRLGEWVIGSEKTDLPLTPTNFIAHQYTNHGSSEAVRPLLVGDAVIFLQRHDQRVRELGFVADRETYEAADLTRLAEHLLTPDLRITSMAWQESREPTLWCVVSDGTLRTLTYIRSERVFAWARHSTLGGRFIAVAVSQTNQDDDEVYFLIRRGLFEGRFTLEVLPANAQNLNESGQSTTTSPSATLPAVYDCQYTGPPINGVLPNFARWQDAGQQSARFTPAADSANLPTIRELTPPFPGPINPLPGDAPIAGVDTYVAGLPITARIVTLPLEVPTETGTSLTRYKNAAKLHACLYRGRNLETIEYRANADAETSLPWAPMLPSRESATRYVAFPPSPASAVPAPAHLAGWVEANVNLSSLNLAAELRHTAPTPCTITALVWDLTISPE